MHQPVNSAAFLLFCSVLFTGPFESSSALAQATEGVQDSEAALRAQVVEMPELPQPEDFFPSDGVVIESPKPIKNGLFGTCMQRVERDGGDAVLVGQSRSIRAFVPNPSFSPLIPSQFPTEEHMIEHGDALQWYAPSVCPNS